MAEHETEFRGFSVFAEALQIRGYVHQSKELLSLGKEWISSNQTKSNDVDMSWSLGATISRPVRSVAW